MTNGDSPLRYTPTPTDLDDWRRHSTPISPFKNSPESFPYRCYKVNNDYISILLMLLDYYVYSDAFLGDEYEQRQSAAWVEDLRYILMTGNVACFGELMMRIRQGSSDVCVLEVSYDGGDTWSIGFDFGKNSAPMLV